MIMMLKKKEKEKKCNSVLYTFLFLAYVMKLGCSKMYTVYSVYIFVCMDPYELQQHNWIKSRNLLNST